MKTIFTLIIASLCILPCPAKDKTTNIRIIQTSDIHGNYFPYDFINGKQGSGSLAKISTFVNNNRKKYGNRLILLDNGDILQGQPSAYYFNYIDSISPHLCADIMNYMHYDVGNMGNHDVETGHQVFDRWISQCNFPVLGANIIDASTGQPYLPPYHIINRDGVKIAILGLITPAIPAWLPQQLWSGLKFDDMTASAEKWIKVLREKEHADIIIGLFHAGQAGNLLAGKYDENASLKIAETVPGFDAILMGHDHQRECKNIINALGDSVLVLDPANNGNVVSVIDISVTKHHDRLVSKNIKGTLTNINNQMPDSTFLDKFAPQRNAIDEFVSKKIGTFENTISSNDAFWGPSSFIDFIHSLQLSISGAEISFVAPLSYDAEIQKGDIYMKDMFKLYKYENMLYVMELSGQEIKDYLEYSYAHWTNQMHSTNDKLLLYKEATADDPRSSFQNPIYNFDSAAGIIYTVDVSKPAGNKISIKSLSDGTPFDLKRSYRVALNSYRGNGGGDILTQGAHIPQEDLSKRVIYSTDKDLRYYLMKYIEDKKTLNPQPLNNWHFIPEDWVNEAIKREKPLLDRR